MKGVTKRQREIIDFIQEFISSHRYSPSYREIGHHFGFSSLGSVHKHVDALKRKGLLAAQEKSSRSLAPLEPSPTTDHQIEIDIPLIGQVTAGQPIQTFSQSQHVAVPRSLIHVPEKTYALRIHGDGLNEEMIAEGDIILVEARQQAHPGETVIALINGHDTIIKKIYPEGQQIRLTGCRAHHHPIIVKTQDIFIQGIVLALLRHMG